jgi:hypothetical protein
VEPAGRHGRRLLLARADLARAKAVAHVHGAAVNDLVLAAEAAGCSQAGGNSGPG